MMHDDEDGGPESDAIQSILDMLDSKGGELMKEKHGPKEPVAGHVVTVEIKPHAGAKAADDDIDEDMLKHLLGDGDDGDEAKE